MCKYFANNAGGARSKLTGVLTHFQQWAVRLESTAHFLIKYLSKLWNRLQGHTFRNGYIWFIFRYFFTSQRAHAHVMFIQRRINVVDVNATLYKRHMPAGLWRPVCYPAAKPILKRDSYKGNNLLPRKKTLSYRINPFSEGRQRHFKELPPLKAYYFP